MRSIIFSCAALCAATLVNPAQAQVNIQIPGVHIDTGGDHRRDDWRDRRGDYRSDSRRDYRGDYRDPRRHAQGAGRRNEMQELLGPGGRRGNGWDRR